MGRLNRIPASPFKSQSSMSFVDTFNALPEQKSPLLRKLLALLEPKSPKQLEAMAAEAARKPRRVSVMSDNPSSPAGQHSDRSRFAAPLGKRSDGFGRAVVRVGQPAPRDKRRRKPERSRDKLGRHRDNRLQPRRNRPHTGDRTGTCHHMIGIAAVSVLVLLSDHTRHVMQALACRVVRPSRHGRVRKNPQEHDGSYQADEKK